MRHGLCKGIVTAAIAFLISGGAVAEAGILGNPSGTIGRGNAALGLEYDYRRGVTDNESMVGSDASGELEFRSNRYLARASLGAFDWLDLYFRIGAADIGFPADSAGDPDFNGTTRFAIGGGFTLRLYERESAEGLSARVLVVGQGLRFNSQGNARVPGPPDADWYTSFRNEYTWNEMDVGLLLAFTTPSLDSRGNVRLTPYVGIEKSFIDGENDRTQFLNAAGQRQIIGSDEVDFADDGMPLRPVLGMEVNMPRKYVLSFEVTIIDSKEFSFGVGISQVAALKRTVVGEKASDYRL